MSDAPQIRVRDAPPRVVWALEQAGVHPLLARLYAARGVRGADDLEAAVRQALAADGPTVIEAVVDSEHYIDTVYD